MCANRTASLGFTAPAPTSGRSMFVMAMLTFVEAFQEALAMRRAAHKSVFLGDE